jgi:hypothetical protein
VTEKPRQLALLLDDGTVVRDPDWYGVDQIHASFHAFGVNRVYGIIVDAETLEQVYPPSEG